MMDWFSHMGSKGYFSSKRENNNINEHNWLLLRDFIFTCLADVQMCACVIKEDDVGNKYFNHVVMVKNTDLCNIVSLIVPQRITLFGWHTDTHPVYFVYPPHTHGYQSMNLAPLGMLYIQNYFERTSWHRLIVIES